MGRYRELVAVLVQHSNITARAAAQPQELAEGVRMTSVTWQVLEYLIEHENDDACMIHISDTLGIPQSSFSRIARQLTELGLVARYRTTANRKNVILKLQKKRCRYMLPSVRSFLNVTSGNSLKVSILWTMKPLPPLPPPSVG